MNRIPIGFMVAISIPIPAMSYTHTIVVRDHLKASSSEATIQARLGDTTAGSWTGTLPGIDGLPTPAVLEDPPFLRMRTPLSLDTAPLKWPARAVVRLDLKTYTGKLYPRCSGFLVGPKHLLTASHCLVSPTSISTIQEQWVSDSFFVRPAFNLGRDYSGTSPVRVVRSTISKTVFPISGGYNGDNDWALLELESDLGSALGWAQVYPMEASREDKMIHMMGYPVIPSACRSGQVCDTVSRKDTLCHSWGPLGRNHYGPIQDWVPLVPAWQGESGSGILDCPDDACRSGRLRVRGTRWTTEAINAFDSTMSGVLAKLLENVKPPLSGALPALGVAASGIWTHWDGRGWVIRCEGATEIGAFEPDGSRLDVVKDGSVVRIAPARAKMVLVVARGPGWSRSLTLVVP